MQQSPYQLTFTIDNLFNRTCSEAHRYHCSAKPFHYKTALIKRKESYDTAKTVSFNYRSDLQISIQEDHPAENLTKQIVVYNVTGINVVTEKNNATPKVVLRFELNSHGIIDLVQAKAIYEKIVKINVTEKNSTTGNSTVVEKSEKTEEKFPLIITKGYAYPLPFSEKQFILSRTKLQQMDNKEEKRGKEQRVRAIMRA